ncbi:MAG: hypothetical protein M1816_003622 [Peltula sp. TS41687]|nr:MAG: hypothetical protein M1816_003622 [Peltula sp. TS41687]
MKLSTLLFGFLLPLALAMPAPQEEGSEDLATEGADPGPGGDGGAESALSADAAAARRITCTAKANVHCRSCPYYPTCPSRRVYKKGQRVTFTCITYGSPVKGNK